MYLLLALVFGFVVDFRLQNCLGLQCLQTKPQTVGFMAIVAVFFMMDLSVDSFFLNIALIAGMMYATYYDLYFYKVERWVHFYILIVSSLFLSFDQIISVALPNLILAFLLLISIDLLLWFFYRKLAMAIGDVFYLSVLSYTFGLTFMLLGLFLAMVLLQLIVLFDRNLKQAPFIPYINFGMFLVLFATI